MKNYPAIAMIEHESIACGLRCADVMAKEAPISVMKSGTVHNGKYLILIGGSVAAVETAYTAGLRLYDESPLDDVFLPDVDLQVYQALLGKRQPCLQESLAILETRTVSTLIRAIDAGIKGAQVKLIDLRIADDLGGKGFAYLNGRVEETEAALTIARQAVKNESFWLNQQIIPRLNEDLINQINISSRYAELDLQQMAEGEL